MLSASMALLPFVFYRVVSFFVFLLADEMPLVLTTAACLETGFVVAKGLLLPVF